MNLNRRELIYKILVGGNGGTGKTTLLHRYVDGVFLENTKMTVGIEFHQKDLELGDGNKCSLILWDTGGEYQFRTLVQGYIKGSVGGLILIDLTRFSTLKSVGEWVNIFRKEDPSLPLLLIGAKNDLVNRISIHDADVLELVDKHDFFDYIKISSKTGENVEECFKILTNYILIGKQIA